jgi:transcriptional regulator with XRE-family HTH domain
LLSSGVRADRDWEAVGAAVRERMTALQVRTAALSRRTGLSETTIRCLARGTSPRQASTLDTVSAVPGWPPSYLRWVADREPLSMTPTVPVREALARIERKLDVLLAFALPGEGRRGPRGRSGSL